MKSDSLKTSLVSWIQSIEDEILLKKIAHLMHQIRIEDFENRFPVLTLEEIKARIAEGLADAKAGNMMDGDQLREEMKNW